MKRLSYLVAQFAVVAAVVFAPSCGNSNDTASAADSTATDAVVENDSTKVPVNLAIRFIDDERLMEEYNLAKDFKETIQRSQSKFMSAQQSREKELQQLGAQIENKLKSNSYTSESEYNADMARAQKKQQDAQTYLANLQRTTELEITQLQTQLQDSIKTYIQSYSKEKGYDAVLMKSASGYFNPVLDVTNEVLAGLNSRYNKVSK